MKKFGFPRKDALKGGEDGSKIAVWILTPTGTTTPNSVHIWMDDKIWNDLWIWTEEAVSYMFPLTKYGTVPLNTIMRWDDTKQFLDNLIWTENI